MRIDLIICSRRSIGRPKARVRIVSAFLAAFLLSSTAILAVVLGVFGAYCAIHAVLAIVNPSQPSNLLAALIPNQSQASGD
jgi:heme A synthase